MRASPHLVHTTLAFAALAAACAQPREPKEGEGRCASYSPQAQPILDSRCGSCHSGDSAAGGYRTDSYLGAVARQDDGTPRVSPGDEGSMLLAAARGELRGHETALAPEELAVLRSWVVDCRLAAAPYRVHLKGWMNPADPDEFHGAMLRSSGYPFDLCRRCHGDDFRGGTAQVSCYQCHAKGPTACNTCHGDASSAAPPRALDGTRATTSLGVGAHRSHLSDGPLHKAYACSVCHAVPNSYDDEGHIDGAPDSRPAEVVLPSSKDGPAEWDRVGATCRNVYCHSPGTQDGSATNRAPKWTAVGAEQAACGSCHGIPPASHTSDRCELCHPQAYSNGKLVAAVHANGKVDVGDGSGGCSACHGDASSPAPPRDLHGNTDESVQTVGAHRAHLEARHRLRGPIACSECHAVPASLHDKGHIDSLPPAELFPALPGVGTLASTDNAVPGYDPVTATCSNVYCHGGGTRGANDLSPGIKHNPVWNGGASQASCGSCHGLPPQDNFHPVGIGITQCVTCHAATIDATGALKVTPNPSTGVLESTHINGLVERGG